MRHSRRKRWLAVCALALMTTLALAALVQGIWNRVLGPEGHYFDSAGGVRIHYTDEGEGLPVLLVHGLAGTNRIEWHEGLRTEILKAYRVIAVDMRGHGRSGKPHDPDSYGTWMIEDLVGLMDHLGMEKAHVVGYSMGGYVVLKMVAMYPERLLSAAPCAIGWQRATAENLDFVEALANALRKGKLGPDPARLGFNRPFKWWERLGIKVGLTYFNDPHALAAVMRASPQLELTESELRQNVVPTLTIVGTEDSVIREARALTEAMGNHELVVVDGTDHLTTKDSGTFLPVLMTFLNEHDAGLRTGSTGT